MKIKVLSKKVICSNEDSIHSYFGWPSVARLHDGRLAMVASGFRVAHICPFGKAIISYSDDEGKTWSLPSVIIDTPLDDRDAGITVFGEKDVIVTSFNNSIEAQRSWSSSWNKKYITYVNAYLDAIEKQGTWEKYLGSTYRISHDDGKSYGEICKIPVTCPHGPAAMPDGTLLYVGRKFSEDDSFHENEKHLSCYKMYPDGRYEFLSEIENIGDGIYSAEPHALVLENGKILVHIRVQNNDLFTIYQCESEDGGRSFTKPHRLLEKKGGAPAHLIKDGNTIISVYGYRNEPYGIRAMFSWDEGKTWDTDHVIVNSGLNGDIGYPASVVLSDGKILTVYYVHPTDTSSAVIAQVIWEYQR